MPHQIIGPSLLATNAGLDTHQPQSACGLTADLHCCNGAAAKRADAEIHRQATAQQLSAQTGGNGISKPVATAQTRGRSAEREQSSIQQRRKDMAGFETCGVQNVHQGMGDGHTEPMSTRELWKRTRVSYEHVDKNSAPG